MPTASTTPRCMRVPPTRIGRSALGESRSVCGMRAQRPSCCRIDQRSPQQKRDELHGDDVEHDRREDLVDPEVRLQRPGNRPPDTAADHPADEDQREQDRAGQITERQGGDRREQGAEEDLPLAADVDHPCPEGDADTGSDEEQRRRLEAVSASSERPPNAPENRALYPSHGRRAEQPDHQRRRRPRHRARRSAEPLHRSAGARR